MDLITSRDLPQADRLESVLRTVEVVRDGARRDIDIANEIRAIQGDDRQGRYYRNAAKLLGFIENQNNYATITEKGQELIQNLRVVNPLLIRSIIQLKVFQKLIPFLEKNPESITRSDIKIYLQKVAVPELTENMINRRLSTLVSWLRSIGFLVENGDGSYSFRNNFDEDVPVLELNDITQPLLPNVGDLTEFERIAARTTEASEEVTYWRNHAAIERAIQEHHSLVNFVAHSIRENNGISKSNQLVDLAVKMDKDFFFEMKTTSEANTRSQVRKGLSQLYENRYL